MTPTYTTRCVISGRVRPWWILGLLPLLLVAPAYSQSLADIARQERERKMNRPHRATHVYTNEDLERPQILLPEDRERIQAKKKVIPGASEPAEEVTSSEPQLDELPLGTIARHYRALKEAGQKTESPSRAPQLAPSMPSLTHPTFSRPLVRIAPPPARLQIDNTHTEPAGKSPRGKEITGGIGIRVQAGDTLWNLAKKYLGRGKDWMLLAAINPQVSDPTRLRLGAWVRLPDRALVLDPPMSVRIERGDTLWKLTQAHFGNGAAWQCLAQANPEIRNVDLIFAGQTLTIPTGCDATPFPRVYHPTVSSESLPSSTAGAP